MLLRDEVKLVGYGALAIAAVLVIMALLLAPFAGIDRASNQATSRYATPQPVRAMMPVVAPVLLLPDQPRMVRTERVVDYPTPTAQERAAGIVLLRQAFAAEAAAPSPVGGLPVWWTAETRYLPPLSPERPGEAPRRTGEAPKVAAAPSVVDQKETGRQEIDRPTRAACSSHGLRTVWEGQYRWRCRR